MDLNAADRKFIDEYVRREGLLKKFTNRRKTINHRLRDWPESTREVYEEYARRYFPDRLWEGECAALAAKSSRFREDVEWVYKNFSAKGLLAASAPSMGAWGLYEWAQENRNKFFGDLVPRYMAKYQEVEEERERLEDDGRAHFRLLDRFSREVREAGVGQKIKCSLCGGRIPVPPVIFGSHPDVLDKVETK